MKALLVAVYLGTENENILTRFGENLKNGENKKIIEHFESTVETIGPLKLEKLRTFYKLTDDYPIVTFVGLGDKDATFSKRDDLHIDKENIKKAIATGIDSIKKSSSKVNTILLDDCNGNFKLVGLTIGLSTYSYKDHVDLMKEEKEGIKFELDFALPQDETDFLIGRKLAKLQNLSRLLSETPSNLCTPTRVAEMATDLCSKYDVEIIVHDREWAKEMKMNSFLSVDQGSCEECKFIELHYKHPDCEKQKPCVFVGKGITFDSGGISLKKASGMDSQRADMTGSACVLSTMLGIAKLKIKGHFIGLMPMCENLPSGKATKPGDVVIAMNGKSIQINNTDAEGRLILADALTYADTFNPEIVIDIATLTGAARSAIGGAANVVFSTSDELYNDLRKSGQLTGQRVWRFPFYSDYLKKTSNSILADMVNQSKDTSYGASHCIAAAFLSQFTKCDNYIHIDMAPTKTIANDHGYMSKGMSGGPVLSLIQFIEKLYS